MNDAQSTAVARRPHRAENGPLPVLESGDRLTQPEFHRRYEAYPDDVKIELDQGDVRRAKQIASYEWFREKREWQKEIQRLLSNGFKMEVESLISKSISYVTEEYVPERLKRKDWLD